jgi:hypothetical protein
VVDIITNKKIPRFSLLFFNYNYNSLLIKSNNSIELPAQVQIINKHILLYSMSSSSQDEIIEISNPTSASSLDINFSKPIESAFIHSDLSISSKATSESTAAKISSPLSASKSNKRYQCKFRKEWLSKSDFSTFLRECKVDPTKALCITCNVQFSIQNSGLGDINHHIKTKKHQQCTKSAEANPCKTYFPLPILLLKCF